MPGSYTGWRFCVQRRIVRRVLTMNLPPDMRTLMADPAFAKMMRTRPRVPANLVRPELSPMWQVWVLTGDDHWRRAQCETYDRAWQVFRRQLENDSVQDVAIVNVRQFSPPPAGFKWAYRKYPWCARCRRPSLFLERHNHRALTSSVITHDEAYRCFYCGIRQVALPRYSPIRAA